MITLYPLSKTQEFILSNETFVPRVEITNRNGVKVIAVLHRDDIEDSDNNLIETRYSDEFWVILSGKYTAIFDTLSEATQSVNLIEKGFFGVVDNLPESDQFLEF